MAQNTASPDSHEIPLTVYGGLCTFIDPTSIPDGVSPDCQNVQFAPGGVSSRPGLKKRFASAFGSATVTYNKSYVDPKGVIRNLYLDSAGNLWVENVTNSAGTYPLLTTTTPGSYAKSSTAFGREYIAISDTLHGSDIPLQYDGTNLDRVTQDGPGAPPAVTSLALPSSAMVASGGPAALTITFIEATDFVSGFDGDGNEYSYYTSFTVTVTSGASGLQIGNSAVIAANTEASFNGTWYVSNVIGDTQFVVSTYIVAYASGTGGTATIGSGVTMTRVGNIVTVTTATDHGLNIGYQAQIANVPASVVGSTISSVTINNEDLPGRATVTTSAAHGLVPGLVVSLKNIVGAAVGGGATAIARAGGIVTVTTATAHNLTPGAVVTLAAFSVASFNTTVVVQNVPTSTKFTFAQVDVDITATTGTVTLNWPLVDTSTPTYFEVVSAPTTTTFQVQINYSNGSWSGGTVNYAWDGTFFVKAVPSTTSFQYEQYGPNATTSSVGLVVPYGQVAPGKHQMQVAFLTRQGYITRPSPPVKFVANGGQYVSVTNIPIGPANVVARLLLFTGAEGAYFYYIPVPAQVNGQVVSTATQIDDNTTVAAVLDFSDNTLYAALGVSTQGNNLANQVILDGALGFAKYSSRLITYGRRNTIQNLLNMGFDGGYFPTNATQPTGWNPSGGIPGILVSGHYGSGYRLNVAPGSPANLNQSFYEDAYGAPVGIGGANYKIRVWLKPAVVAVDVNFKVVIQSASTGFASLATINGSLMSVSGSWLEADFSVKMPVSISPDTVIAFYGDSTVTTTTLIVDELSVIFSDTPYVNTLLGSYVNNAEAFDGLSGVFGPSDDTHQPLAAGIIRSNLYLLTKDPGGRLHQVSASNAEPSQWVVDEVGQNCGTVSALSLAVSQANDNSGGGGEEWFSWYSSSGPRIFGGEFPFKIGQEIMRRSNTRPPGAPDDLSNANAGAMNTVWGLNDPEEKIMYFGVPMDDATAPSTVWMMNYLGCETAGEIASQDPVHRAPNSGKMTANDLGRKWSPWNRPINSAALLLDADGGTSVSLCGGNGLYPNTSSSGAYGNVYSLDQDLLTDDNYGIIVPYYTTYAFPDPLLAQALGIGGGLKMVSYAYGLISGTGTMTFSVRYNLLSKIWRISQPFTMSETPDNDSEWGAGQVTGKRFWFRFASTPASGTDNRFELNSWTVAIKKNARMPVRGCNR